MYYKIASLILNSGQKNNTISDVFISQPDSAKEALVGKLFVMAEIESQKTEGAKLLDFIINNLNFNYYQNEKVVLRERIDTISVESVFESALSKTNRDLVEFIGKEKIKISPYSLNLTVCLLYENELYFTNIGKNKCLLLHKEKTSSKSAKGRNENLEKIEYKLTDIDRPSENDNEAVTMNKIFSEVMSGKIPPGGYFLIINEALSEYLSGKQLIDITTKLSPTGAVEQIRNLLEKINSYVSFLGVIVKNTSSTGWSGEELKRQIDNEIKNWDYKPEIVSTEERTEAILTPAGAIDLKRWIKALTGKSSAKKRPATTNPTPLGKKAGKIFLLKDKIFVKRRASIISAEKIMSLFGKSLSFIKKAAATITSKKDSGIQSDMSEMTIDGSTDRPWLAKKGPKLFLVAAMVLIVALIGNSAITKKRQEEARKQSTFNALISEIDKNQGRVDSFLIYENIGEAKQLWDSNQQSLSMISEEQKAGRGDIGLLFKKQSDQLLKIRRIKNISEVKKIADFSNLNKDAKPGNLTLFNGKLYAASSEERAVYKVDIKDGLVTASYNIANVSRMDRPSVSTEGVIYLDDKAVTMIGKQDDISNIKVKNPPESIGGAGTYNNRLYLVDKVGGQIWRYVKTEEGFSSPEEWLENKTDLSATADIFIDGNIYILNGNGTIDKYLKGKKEVFSLSSVDEPIAQATKLIVGESDFYVFEAPKNRLVSFDAKGQLLAQYIISTPEGITDISISDKDKQIYILSGQSVYQASLE